MAEETKLEEHPVRTLPSRNLGDTALDMSQPDGIPLPKPVPPKGPDGKFISPNPPEQPNVFEHPRHLVELAKDFGLDDEDIGSLDDEALTRAIRLVRKRDGVLASNHNRDRAAEAAMQRQPPKPPEPEPEPEIELGIDEEAFGPELVGALKKVAAEPLKKIRELEKKLAEQHAQNEARSIAQATEITEEAFEAIAAEYPELFGKGNLGDLKTTDPDAHYRRLVLFNRAGVDPRTNSGKVLLQKLRAAIPSCFPGATAKAKEPEGNPYEAPIAAAAAKANGSSRPTKAEFAQAGTAVPTHRAGAHEPKGAEAAEKAIARKLREEGGGSNSEEERENARILGTLKRSK